MTRSGCEADHQVYIAPLGRGQLAANRDRHCLNVRGDFEPASTSGASGIEFYYICIIYVRKCGFDTVDASAIDFRGDSKWICRRVLGLVV